MNQDIIKALEKWVMFITEPDYRMSQAEATALTPILSAIAAHYRLDFSAK